MSAQPTGIVTNGIGAKTTAHLNLTVSLAVVAIRNRPTKRQVGGGPITAEERSRRISEGLQAYHAQKRAEALAKARKIKFAGFDPREIRLQLPRAE